jgi:hypothetical protein
MISILAHLYRTATVIATGEIVRLDYFSSFTNSYDIIIFGDSHSYSSLHATALCNFSR